MNTDASPDFLRALRFPEGQTVPAASCIHAEDCQRIYNEREVIHLYDVKVLLQAAVNALLVSASIVLLGALTARLQGWQTEFWLAIGRGGWLTVILTGIVIAFVLLAFQVIFVAFHEVFFAPSTWTFFHSDTLIRLFPERFWFYTFLWVAGVPALVGALLGWRIPHLVRKAD